MAGAISPPEAIEKYEALLPGTFDRLIRMAEKQQDAVIASAADARNLQQKDTRRGQILGALVTALCVLAAVYCAFIGHISVAIALVAVPIMAVPVALISGKRMPSETPKPKLPEQKKD